MESSRGTKDRKRKRKKFQEAEQSNAQIRRAWRTGRRHAPKECFEKYGETTCKGCVIVDNCRLQDNELQRIRRKK